MFFVYQIKSIKWVCNPNRQITVSFVSPELHLTYTVYHFNIHRTSVAKLMIMLGIDILFQFSVKLLGHYM
jgi:hypothetical protein